MKLESIRFDDRDKQLFQVIEKAIYLQEQLQVIYKICEEAPIDGLRMKIAALTKRALNSVN